jgi:hypothetical protein
MKKFTDTSGSIAPPASTVFSDAVFAYSLSAGGTANCTVPPGANFVEVTASQFVAVSPATVSGAPASSPSGTSGSQTVNFSGAINGGTPTGLANDGTKYTSTFTIDGSQIPWFDVGSNLQTYGALVTSFNTILSTKASAALVNGSIVVTSATTGVNSKVSITSAPIITPSPSPTRSVTVTASSTPTPTVTSTPSQTHSITPTLTRTPSVTPSVTDSPGLTPNASPTPTHSNTPTLTRTASPTPSVTPTHSATPTLTTTITVSASVTPTVTVSHTVSPTITVTPSQVGSGVFSALTLNATFALPVNGALISSNSEVVLRTVKVVTGITTVGVYAFTSGTQLSLAFYA